MSSPSEAGKVEKATDLRLAEVAVHAARCAAPIFAAQNWKYGGFQGVERFTPDEAQLASAVERLLRRVRDEETDCVSSGRFTVTSDITEGREDLYVSLELGSTDDLA
jgi:hypothetical protein